MNSTSPLSRINLPLAALWAASVAAIAGGYLMMQSGNAGQVELYTTQSGDYDVLFAAQSASTIGGFLIAVGALGLLLALATHAAARSRINALAATAVAASPVVVDTDAAIEAELDAEDEASAAVTDAEPVAPAKAN